MRAKKTGWVIEKPARELRPSQCRVWMQRTLAKHFPAILERFLNDATPQSLSHMRMVTELLEADVRKAKRKRDPFRALLRDLVVEEKAGVGKGPTA